MTAVEDRPARASNPSATAADRPIGFGRIQRKEDPRFVRGKGRYLDDIVLPGMLHGAMLRSPLAHARVVSIDTTEALAHPKVLAGAAAPLPLPAGCSAAHCTERTIVA